MLQILGVLIFGYLLLVGVVYIGQTRMLYHPENQLLTTPRSAGLEYEDIYVETSDRVKIHGWWIPRQKSRATVLFCHGNAGNISGRIATAKLLHDLGLNVFLFDYRGYGQSEGSPTETGTYRDAQSAWNWLVDEQALAPSEIFVMGRSLGGAVAAQLASEVQPGALLLESTFTSAADLGQHLYPVLPVRWLLKYRYPTKKNMMKYEGPTWIGHSREDGLVPFEHGQLLYEAAPEPKTFIELEGSHGEAFLETGERYKDKLDKFIDGVLLPKVEEGG